MRNFTAQHIGRAFGLDLWTVVTIQMIPGFLAQPLRGGMVDGFADRCCDLNDFRADSAAPQGRLAIFLGPLMVGWGGHLILAGSKFGDALGEALGGHGKGGREGFGAALGRLLELFGRFWEATGVGCRDSPGRFNGAQRGWARPTHFWAAVPSARGPPNGSQAPRRHPRAPPPPGN